MCTRKMIPDFLAIESKKPKCTKSITRELQKRTYRVNNWVPEPSAAANNDL